jgi:hypothetical protein
VSHAGLPHFVLPSALSWAFSFHLVGFTANSRYDSSTTATQQISKHAPKPPKTASSEHHELKKFIETVHLDSHDPNDLFILPTSEQDRKTKGEGMVGGFLKGRQDALDK